MSKCQSNLPSWFQTTLRIFDVYCLSLISSDELECVAKLRFASVNMLYLWIYDCMIFSFLQEIYPMKIKMRSTLGPSLFHMLKWNFRMCIRTGAKVFSRSKLAVCDVVGESSCLVKTVKNDIFETLGPYLLF